MINIIFPSGGYGQYFATLIYTFTDITAKKIPTATISIETGSSHAIEKQIKNVIALGHKDTQIYSTPIDYTNKTLCLIPDKNNMLDYLDNVLTKTEGVDKNYKNMQIFASLAEQKISNWKGSSVWEDREWISFFILDLFNCESYKFYHELDAVSRVSTNVLFDDNFIEIFDNVVTALDLRIINTHAVIEQFHRNFLYKQKFHNIQHKCNNWVNSIISGKATTTPCVTIFDEAYVQACLRNLGFEIRCFELNEFPKDSAELKKLLIPASN